VIRHLALSYRPEERIYSDYGELIELHTFRGGSEWNNPSWPTGQTGTPDVTHLDLPGA
jgi:hypothetical protein